MDQLVLPRHYTFEAALFRTLCPLPSCMIDVLFSAMSVVCMSFQKGGWKPAKEWMRRALQQYLKTAP